MFGKDNEFTDKMYDKGDKNIIAMIKFLAQPLVENMKEFAENKKYF